MKLLLSPEAVRDIAEIFDFSADRWGEAQAERYVRDLHAACDRLTSEPALGHRRGDIPAPWLVHPVASHLIVYRINTTDDRIEVLNILHPAMDVGRRLTQALERARLQR